MASRIVCQASCRRADNCRLARHGGSLTPHEPHDPCLAPCRRAGRSTSTRKAMSTSPSRPATWLCPQTADTSSSPPTRPGSSCTSCQVRSSCTSCQVRSFMYKLSGRQGSPCCPLTAQLSCHAPALPWLCCAFTPCPQARSSSWLLLPAAARCSEVPAQPHSWAQDYGSTDTKCCC